MPELDDDEPDDTEPQDLWDEFRGESDDAIGIEELKSLDLASLPHDVSIRIMDNYFPDTRVI